MNGMVKNQTIWFSQGLMCFCYSCLIFFIPCIPFIPVKSCSSVLFFPFRQVALSLSRQVGRFLSIFPVAGTFHEGYKFQIAGAR